MSVANFPVEREVVRHNLQRRLRLSALRPFTVVQAPAGYGKSTVLRQTASSWRREGAVVLEPPRESIVSGRALPEMNRAVGASAPAVVILDHLHSVDPGLWDTRVAEVVGGLRPQQHAILVVRQEIPPAVRQAAEPLRRHVIDSDDLRFTIAECRRLVALGRQPANDVTWGDCVHRMTGGWPIAIASLAHAPRLSAETLPSDAPSEPRIIPGIVPGNRWESYVCDEILKAQPPPAQAFLLASALLGEAHVDLCNAVLGRKDSFAIIQMLVAREFLIPGTGGWFTHHPLLAETLRRRQHREEPLWSQAVHQLAAGWHLSRGDHRRAFGQFMALGDHARAASLLVAGATGPVQAAASQSDAAPLRLSVAPSRTVLTARESEVLELIRSGLGNREIGRALYVSLATVKAHVYSIFRKLGVSSRTAAVAHGRNGVSPGRPR